MAMVLVACGAEDDYEGEGDEFDTGFVDDDAMNDLALKYQSIIRNFAAF